MKDFMEALAVVFGGFFVLLLVAALVAGGWWLVGWLTMWVWSVTIGPAPMLGWQCGLILFTCHILFKTVTGIGSH